MTSLQQEIEDKIETLWSVKTSYFSDEKYNFDDCAKDIIKLIKDKIDEIQTFRTDPDWRDACVLLKDEIK